MPSRFRWVVIVVGATVSVGCNPFTGTTCTSEARAALVVDVRGSSTNAPAGRGARIIASDGAFADTASTSGDYDGPYQLAHERAGTYTVTVEKEGYRGWSQSGIRVTKGECHVRTVNLTARLQP